MILESIVTTRSRSGETNLAPMGPVFDGKQDRFELRPFAGSQTLANLEETRQGVLHVTDDVDLFAKAVTGELDPLPPLIDATCVEGHILANTCRWYEFKVTFIQPSSHRTSVHCQVVHSGRKRDFCGFNRAKAMIIEAAILATRTDFLPLEEILAQFRHFENIIGKTGGQSEREAFERLQNYVSSKSATSAAGLPASPAQAALSHPRKSD
ncbi:MAG: DUF447 domain-containing protein [Planctomycetota bacterium]|nr:DUF447 domain-containing protein [Planctomycetota bacterium]